MRTPEGDLAEAARQFLAAAWSALEKQRVVPPPVFHSYIQVGRDYYGSDVMSLPEFDAFQRAIRSTYPRFNRELLQGGESPDHYIFGFLERFVACATKAGETFDPSSRIVDEVMYELTQALQTSAREYACCRYVSHLTTVDRKPLKIAGFTVTPIGAQPHDQSQSAAEVMNSIIPGATSAFARVQPTSFSPPESIISIRGQEVGARNYSDNETSSGKH